MWSAQLSQRGLGVIPIEPVERTIAQPVHPARIGQQGPSDGDDVELTGPVLIEEPVDRRRRNVAPGRPGVNSISSPTEPTAITGAPVTFFVHPDRLSSRSASG
jgi:hypothetical protein